MTAEKQGEHGMPVTFEKARVNIYNIIGFATVIAGSAFGWGVTWANVNGNINAVAAKVDKLEERMPEVSGLKYQVQNATKLADENKQATEETNRRIDRAVDTFSNKMDTVISLLSKQGTDIEVLKNDRGLRK